MTSNPYLFAAYLAVWTVLFVYLFFVHRRQKAISKDLRHFSDSLRTREED